MERLFTVSATPHVRDKTNIPIIMYSVVLALLPALAGAVYFFGYRALFLVILTVATCIATEGIIQKLAGKPLTMFDGSAIVTGILLAFNLPGGVPWWIPVVGGFFAIAVGKISFGGLGYNPMNPALLGRIFLLISWTGPMTSTWTKPRGIDGIDAETVATPLAILKENIAVLKSQDLSNINEVNAALSKVADLEAMYGDLFFGRVSGCIGETSVFLLIIGALFLLYKRYIDWHIPLTFIGTVALFAWIFGGYDGLFTGPWLFHVLSGGLIIGAFFMATDMVTSPITPVGQLMFGVGCGILTVIIRLIGGYPEGVSFAIVLMNLTVPLINRYTQPKVFGKRGKRA
ncbi:RnfABCDGE type electron transport complex subunit D [Candidatus Latescibacterota bacterium]